MTDTVRPLRVGMIGHAFMGAMHSHAWRTAPRFFDLPLAPELAAIAGRDPAATAEAARRYGWASAHTDWRELVNDPEIDLIDICTPGNTHHEIAIAALRAGKHVLCEKPLANSVEEAAEMTAAAEEAASRGVLSMCGFSYRRVPALSLARDILAEGRLGRIRHVRAQYLQDWLSDPEAPMTWRLDRALAGSGALGDIGAHVIDATQWILGEEIDGVSAITETFTTRRPRAGGPRGPIALGGGGTDAAAGEGTDTERGTGTASASTSASASGVAYDAVTVDDAAAFTARFSGGALGVFEATRAALGRKNAIRIEINGSLGSVAFDFEDMNVLEYYDGRDPAHLRGFRRILVTEPEHPYTGNWWPAGHGLGYEHSFTHQVVDLVRAIGAGEAPTPSFADALRVQRVLAAVEASAADESRYTRVTPEH